LQINQASMSTLVDVYPYCQDQDGVYLLALQRSQEVRYSGQWRMVGGKVQEEESSTAAARRELKEETGQSPMKFWTVPSINQFYDHQSDAIHQIPAFAAEISKDATIRLNHEHVDFSWISEEQIEGYISWPEQQRLMRLVADIVTHQKILKEWII